MLYNNTINQLLPPDRRGRGRRIRREEGEILLAIQSAGQGAGNPSEHFYAMFFSAWSDKVFHSCVFQKLSLETTIHDPHKLTDIIDPVFSDNVSVHGIKHRLATKKRSNTGWRQQCLSCDCAQIINKMLVDVQMSHVSKVHIHSVEII